MFVCSLAVAADDKVAVLLDQDHPSHQRFAEQIRSALKNTELKIELIGQQLSAEKLASLQHEKFKLLVTVGAGSALQLQPFIRQLDIPVLAALIPHVTFQSLQQGLVETGHSLSAVFLDQPLKRRLRLVQLVLPHTHHIGVLLGPSSSAQLQELKSALPLDWSVHSRTVNEESAVLEALRGTLRQVDLLLALADPVVYNARTAKGVLLTSYRHKVPIMGYSKSYVKAGALFALYSSPEQIARQVAEILQQRQQTGNWHLHQTQHPRYYSIALNRKVARSLEIDLPELGELTRRMLNTDPTKTSPQP